MPAKLLDTSTTDIDDASTGHHDTSTSPNNDHDYDNDYNNDHFEHYVKQQHNDHKHDFNPPGM